MARSFGKYIYRRKGGAYKLNPLCGADVKATYKEAIFSAGGFDQWSTQDFAILDDAAYDWLARMYNQIEKGACWPEPTLHAKGSYLLKNLGDRGDPLGYRVLFVTSVAYRRWTATRLRQSKGWIDE